MTTIPPLAFDFDGEVMRPCHPKLADRHYTVGERYWLEPRNDRSTASHNHFHAIVAEAHSNLPEDLAERYPTPDHLRRWALIKAGLHDSRSIVCASKAEAQRVAAFVRPMDTYAVVIVKESVVMVFTAKSQSYKAMGKKAFAESKEAVLSILAEMIGVSQQQLTKAGADNGG